MRSGEPAVTPWRRTSHPAVKSRDVTDRSGSFARNSSHRSRTRSPKPRARAESQFRSSTGSGLSAIAPEHTTRYPAAPMDFAVPQDYADLLSSFRSFLDREV